MGVIVKNWFVNEFGGFFPNFYDFFRSKNNISNPLFIFAQSIFSQIITDKIVLNLLIK